jgi:hypothetical protein
MIKSQAGRFRDKDFASHPVRGYIRGAFFGSAVYIDRDELPVPMQLLGSVGVVVDVDDGALALFEAKKRARELPVIGGGGNDVLRSYFYETGTDVERIVGRFVGWGGLCASVS